MIGIELLPHTETYLWVPRPSFSGSYQGEIKKEIQWRQTQALSSLSVKVVNKILTDVRRVILAQCVGVFAQKDNHVNVTCVRAFPCLAANPDAAYLVWKTKGVSETYRQGVALISSKETQWEEVQAGPFGEHLLINSLSQDRITWYRPVALHRELTVEGDLLHLMSCNDPVVFKWLL